MCCQFAVTDHVSVLTTSENDHPHATDVTVLFSPDGSASRGIEALTAYMIVVGVLSPSVQRKEQIDFVIQLLNSLNEKNEASADLDGIHYSLAKKSIGDFFSAEPVGP